MTGGQAGGEVQTGEAAAIARAEAAVGGPITYDRLVSDLEALELPAGPPVIVHSSLSAIGWVAGGALVVVDALVAALSPSTVVVPAQSSDRSDPRYWEDPPVPEHWWPIIRTATPAFDPDRVETRGMGRIVEAFRNDARSTRGPHPTVSFAAIGADAAAIVRPHELVPQFGDSSPLGRLYDADATILMIGTAHGSNTSFHLAETRADWPGKPGPIEDGAAMTIDGTDQWLVFEGEMADAADFEHLGSDFEARSPMTRGPVGAATAAWCSMVEAVDFATSWFSSHRGQ